MAVEHKDIADPYIHEPKGVATAALGDVYVADGAGSGAWAAPSTTNENAVLSLGSAADNTTATTLTALDTYYPVAGTWTEEIANVMTTVVGTGRLVCTTAGDYEVRADISMISSRSSAIATFAFMVDGVKTGPRIRRKIGTGADVGALSIGTILENISAASYVQISVAGLTGDGWTAADTVTVENAVLSGKLITAT